LKPHYIFKGKRLNQSWVENDPIGASYSVSDSGWTDNTIGAEWLVKAFDAQTAHHYPNWRCLDLDGHSSHQSYEFVLAALQRRIILVCFPSHATAFLQPLDVAVFSPLSKAWTKVLEEELIGGLLMRKQDFCRYVDNNASFLSLINL
jgi:hypothetical protein